MSAWDTATPRAGWTDVAIESLLAPLEDGRILHQGWSPQCEKDPSPSEELWGVLKTTAIQAGAFCPEHNKLLPPDLSPRAYLEVKEGDLLITCAGPRARCGVACLVRSTRRRLMISGKMYRFRTSTDRLDPRYLEAFLQTREAMASIDKMKTGTSESGLNLTHDRFRRLMVPVAPLNEQSRIIEEIDKQLTRLETGIAALKRVQANLKRYRAAVLKAACEGRLVPTEAALARQEGRPYEPASAFLEAIRAEKAKIAAATRRGRQSRGDFTTMPAGLPALPDGWAWVRLGVLLESIEAGKSFKCLSRPAGASEWGVIKVSAMTWGVFDAGENKAFPAGRRPDPRMEIRPGDILVSRANTAELVGATVLVGECRPRLILSDKSMRLIPLGGLSRQWVRVVLQSRSARQQMSAVATGTSDSMRNISQEKLKAVLVPLAPVAEQDRIVAEVERRTSLADDLERVVSANLHRATRLRQSILAAAFSGRLSERYEPSTPEAVELLRAAEECVPYADKLERTS